jgi:quinol monooxygenase YgiN
LGRRPHVSRTSHRGVRAQGPWKEPETLSFRVYRDPAKADYLLFVEHFEDRAAYDAHTGSAVYRELIAGTFSDLIEINQEFLVSL